MDEIGENPVISKISATGNGIALSVNGDAKVLFTVGDSTPGGSETVTSTAALSFSVPYHITAVYDHTAGGSAKLYVNGTDVTTVVHNGAATALASAEPLRIGAMPKPSPQTGLQYYKGTVDDMRIFSRALSADSVRALSTGKDIVEGLNAKWDFENASDLAFESVYGDSININGTPVQSTSVPPVLNGEGTLFVASQCLDLTAELVNAGYLPRLPYDPLAGTGDTRTFYLVNRDGAQATVRACSAESEGIGGIGAEAVIESSS